MHPTFMDNVSEKDYFASKNQVGFEWHAGGLHHWRCRAKLAVRGTAKRPIVGLFREASHSATAIPGCQVQHPAINSCAAVITQLIAALLVQPYDDASGSGLLRYLQLTVVPQKPLPLSDPDATSLIQVVLVVNATPPSPSRSPAAPSGTYQKCITLAQQLWLLGGPTAVTSSGPMVHSVWLNYHPSTTSNAVLGPDWQLLHGPRLMWLHHPTYSLAFLPGSFIQANYAAAARCAAEVARLVPPKASVSELYAGVGALGLALAALNPPARLRLVEANPHCLEPFLAARAKLPQELDISFHVASAGEDPSQWLEGSEVLIVDPPRRGLDPALLDILCALPIQPNQKLSGHALPEAHAALAASHPVSLEQPSDAAPDNPAPAARCPDTTLATSATTSPPHLAAADGAVDDADAAAAAAADGADAACIHEASAASALQLGGRLAPGAGPADVSTSRAAARAAQLPGDGLSSHQDDATSATACVNAAEDAADGVALHPLRQLHMLVYVSCGFQALRRDCGALVGSGRWRVCSARGFLFFPGTDSLETLVVFERLSAERLTT